MNAQKADPDFNKVYARRNELRYYEPVYFCERMPFESVFVCSDAIHRIYVRRNKLRYYEPVYFCERMPFESVFVCSDAIHRIYVRRNNADCIWAGPPQTCATPNRATFGNVPPFESVSVCSDAIHRIAVEALLQKLSKLYRTYVKSNNFSIYSETQK